MTNINKKKRVIQPRQNISKSDYYVNKVIFSGEKKINVDVSDGLPYYRHDVRKEPTGLLCRVDGRTSIMIQGAISFYEVSELVCFGWYPEFREGLCNIGIRFNILGRRAFQ